MSFVQNIKARWRILFGFCPECNSDAPEVDNCMLCNGYRTPYPPTKATKRLWWRKFMSEGILLKGGKAQAKELGQLMREQHGKGKRHD